jgi:HK97 family phage prohead protease
MSKEINVSYRSMAGEIRKKNDETRTITFVASDGTKDSAGTVLNQDNWDLTRFNSNGIIGYQHKVYGGWDDTDNPDNVIGKGVAYIEDKKLMVDITFEPADINPLADKIYKKIQFGSLRAVSVGFLPVGRGRFGEGADAETYYFAGQQLLEVSVVNIPANPNALKKSLEAENEYLEAERKRLLAEAEAEQEVVEENDDTRQDEAPADDTNIDVTMIMARAALLK